MFEAGIDPLVPYYLELFYYFIILLRQAYSMNYKHKVMILNSIYKSFHVMNLSALLLSFWHETFMPKLIQYSLIVDGHFFISKLMMILFLFSSFFKWITENCTHRWWSSINVCHVMPYESAVTSSWFPTNKFSISCGFFNSSLSSLTHKKKRNK